LDTELLQRREHLLSPRSKQRSAFPNRLNGVIDYGPELLFQLLERIGRVHFTQGRLDAQLIHFSLRPVEHFDHAIGK
jgi:hypothetical protein